MSPLRHKSEAVISGFHRGFRGNRRVLRAFLIFYRSEVSDQNSNQTFPSTART